LFAYITQNWRGKPLVSHKIIIQLIAATSTGKGLTVTCDLDRSRYPRGIKISKAELAAINIERHSFHGEWNCTIKPNKKRKTVCPHMARWLALHCVSEGCSGRPSRSSPQEDEPWGILPIFS
jgi:hypothetical protein